MRNDDIKQAVAALQVERNFLSIAVYEVQGDYAVRIAAAGATCGQCDRVHLSSGNIGAVARTGEPYVCSDVSVDPRYRSCFPGVRSETVIPLKAAGKTVAVIDVEADDRTSIDPAEISTFADAILPFFSDAKRIDEAQ
jgi:L-methionine (R)-S-oxide reductase